MSTIASLVFACTPYESVDASDYLVNDDESNQLNKDFTERDEAITATCDSMQNLMDHLDSTTVSDTGYYIGANITINTDQDTAFILNLQANLYTYPYEMTDANGNVLVDANGDTIIDEEALAIHNQLIKQNDIIIEWYDGMTNEILIGFYFDGVNANSADAGNNLYLNIQGTKRYFTDFGDTVLYQQIVRLITQFDLSSVLGDDDSTGSETDKYDSAAVQTVYELLDITVTDYKKVMNGDDTSYYYPQIPLSSEVDTVTEYLKSFFEPFGDKIDPLTKEYLGFSFWTMGHTEINTMTTNMQYLIAPASTETGGVDMLSGIVIDVWGTATVEDNPDSDYNVSGSVGYESRIAIDYSVRTSSDIVIDKTDYVLYEDGCYEFIGEMWIPMLNLETDALIRTDIQEYDNETNQIFAQFRDIADDSLLIGTYYYGEMTYLDVEGLQGLYGGVQIEDLGLPKAYYEGINVAELLELYFDTIDTYIVLMVDELLSPSDGSSYDNLTEAIMANVWSTEKTDADPTSRNTVTIKIDIELIRLIMQETDENGTEYSNEQMIDIIEDMLGVDLDALAAILGMDVSELMDTTYFTIQLDVDDNSLCIRAYSTSGDIEGTLLIELTLYPTKIGQKVYMVFPNFDDYNPLQQIMTYSATIEGEFVFAATEEVNLSELLGAFIGDSSGLNTVYILPSACDIYFTMEYDQYIRDQILENGRWTQAGRSAFSLEFYTIIDNQKVVIFQAYANDVCFNTAASIEEFGYVWVDLVCVEGVPNVKVREDVFLEAFYLYLGNPVYDDEAITSGVTTIIQALMEDSVITFEPDVIRITTANDSVKDFFQVDELIGNVTAQIGFKQRVTGIDELESTFAMFTVGELSDLSGTSPYELELHQTITVYFDFGTRIEVVEMLVAYEESTITIVNGQRWYYPMLEGRFMGTTRYYMVTITGDLSIDGMEIVRLSSSYEEWEPTAEIPTDARVDLDAAGYATTTYDAVYEVFGTYDRLLDGYVVANDYGYEIIYYEFEDGTGYYVVGMGDDFLGVKTSDMLTIEVGEEIPDEPQYDVNGDPIEYRTDEDILRVLDMGDIVYFRDYVATADVTMTYDISSGYAGYYIVNSSVEILYNMIEDHYIIESAAYLAQAQVALASLGDIEILYAEDAVNGDYDFAKGANVKSYDNEADYITSLYGVNVQYSNELGAYILEDDQYYIVMKAEVINEIDDSTEAGNVLTYKEVMRYSLFVQNASDYEAVSAKYTSFTVTVDTLIDWDLVKAKRTSFDTFDFALVRWVEVLYDKTEWDDITINGGTYKVKVTIGGGMMATYIEIIDVVIVNREIDTQQYVYVYTEEGETVLAPVVNINTNEVIEVNSYVYTLIKADFINNQGKLSEEFTEWFFSVYDITLDFIDYYDGSEELETATVVESFEWNFDCQDGTNNALYSESDISNILPVSSAITTYVYTEYLGQVVALALTVNSSTIDYIMFDGEEEANTYTVDSLLEETYVIPTDPTFYFVEGGTINFSDLTAEGSSIFANNLWAVSDEFYSGDFGSATDIIRPSIIIWTNSEADNIKINWEGEDVKPFKNSNSNVTASFVDVANFVDPTGAWLDTTRFTTPAVYIEIEMPDKIVKVIEDAYGSGYDSSYIYIDSDNPYDLYMMVVDPYDYSTWQLPSSIGIWFESTGDEDYSKVYEVDWSGYNDGYLTETEVTVGQESYFTVDCKIGNEEIGTITITMVVHKLSGVVTDMTYLDSSSNELSVDYVAEGNDTYNVDTYARFEIPASIQIAFDDGEIRTYSLNEWAEFAPFVPGTTVEGVSSVGDTVLALPINVDFIVDGRQITALEVDGAVDEIAAVTVNVEKQLISILVSSINAETFFVTGTGYNMYDYIMYLLGDLTVTLDSMGITDSYVVDMYDAATSAEAGIFATFDTQLALYEELSTDDGLSITIYVGQWAGAVDYTVNIKLTDGFKIVGSQIVDMELYPYTITEEGAVAQYPDGFVFEDDLSVDIQLEGLDVGVLSGIKYWVVGSPVGYDTDSSTIDGINDGDVITMLDFDILLLGTGTLWISAMYDDSTRIYVHIEIMSEDIGLNYGTGDEYTGYFAINNGVIEVDNFYNVMNLMDNIGNYLPKTIYLNSSEDAINNVTWIVDNATYWADMNYAGTGGAKIVAEAFLMNQWITLYLNILNSTVDSISYNADSSVFEDSTRAYTSSSYLTTGEVDLDIDPYINTGYEGVFNFNGNIILTLVSGATHTVSSGYFTMADVLSTTNYILYDYYGITNYKTGVTNTNSVEVSVYLGSDSDGAQEFTFDLNIIDRTLATDNNSSVVSYDAVHYQGYVILDPYSDTITVSNEVKLYFNNIIAADGVNGFSYTISGWKESYEVKYNTGDGQILSANITYSGLSTQTIYVELQVLDRELDEWSFVDGIIDLLSEDATNPNSYYVYVDPFAGLATDLPNTFLIADDLYATYTDAVNIVNDLEIVWVFEDSDIDADGTTNTDTHGKYGMVIKGYIKNASVGQEITIRVYVYEWEFAAIRKEQNDDYYIMTDDVRFYFSTSTYASSVASYEISFNVYDTYNDGVTTNLSAYTVINKVFIPEDLDIDKMSDEYKAKLASNVSDASMVTEADYPYRIMWDDSAKLIAQEGSAAAGTYYLGNTQEIKVYMSNNSAYYEFEQITITQVDFGFGYGTTNEAIFVVNPLDIDFNLDVSDMTNTSIAQAKGTKNQQTNVELGDIEVIWYTTETIVFADSFIGGGLYKGYQVTLRLPSEIYPDDDSYDVVQTFNVYLIFLDMTPEYTPQTLTSSNFTNGVVNDNTIVTSFTAYATRSYYTTDSSLYTAKYGVNTKHPYGSDDVYNEIVDELNAGVIAQGVNTTTYDYNVISWDGVVDTSLIINQTIYSSEVQIGRSSGGKVYETNIIKYYYSYS